MSNASRTLLFNIHTLDWDDELLRLLDIPRRDVAGGSLLERGVWRDGGRVVRPADCRWPVVPATSKRPRSARPVSKPGSAKNTYGTGCFLLLNIGPRPIASRHGLLTTVGWRIGGESTYCLEGSVFIAGAAVQWLRDGLGLIRRSADVEALAAAVPDAGGVTFVPAFVGLGAPLLGSVCPRRNFGLTRGTTAAHLARATVESMAFQSRDLLRAMQQDAGAQAGRVESRRRREP